MGKYKKLKDGRDFERQEGLLHISSKLQLVATREHHFVILDQSQCSGRQRETEWERSWLGAVWVCFARWEMKISTRLEVESLTLFPSLSFYFPPSWSLSSSLYPTRSSLSHINSSTVRSEMSPFPHLFSVFRKFVCLLWKKTQGNKTSIISSSSWFDTEKHVCVISMRETKLCVSVSLSDGQSISQSVGVCECVCACESERLRYTVCVRVCVCVCVYVVPLACPGSCSRIRNPFCLVYWWGLFGFQTI